MPPKPLILPEMTPLDLAKDFLKSAEEIGRVHGKLGHRVGRLALAFAKGSPEDIASAIEHLQKRAEKVFGHKLDDKKHHVSEKKLVRNVKLIIAQANGYLKQMPQVK